MNEIIMKAKEWLFTNYPQVKDDWGKTGHDDKFMARMMDEYHESQLKILNIPDVRLSLPIILQLFRNAKTMSYKEYSKWVKCRMGNGA